MIPNDLNSHDSDSQRDHHGTSAEFKGLKASYPTWSKTYSYETPFTMGLQKNKTPIEKAADKPFSLRLAINAKCFDCVGCGFDPKPAKDIRNCGIVDCPLWPVRPYQNKKPVHVAKQNTGLDLSLQQSREVNHYEK